MGRWAVTGVTMNNIEPRVERAKSADYCDVSQAECIKPAREVTARRRRFPQFREC